MSQMGHQMSQVRGSNGRSAVGAQMDTVGAQMGRVGAQIGQVGA